MNKISLLGHAAENQLRFLRGMENNMANILDT